MTRDEVLEMARKAGVLSQYEGEPEYLERFAALVAERTQEECARVCEERGMRNRAASGMPNGDRDEFYCADDIRSMKAY